MHRIDGEGSAAGMFTDLDPSIGQMGTVMTADWANAMQEEIVGVVLASGATLSKSDNTQLLTALNARYGRLANPNTWTSAQAMQSTLAVTGNTTVGGTLGVTGNASLSGTLSAGATTVASLNAGSGAVSGGALSGTTGTFTGNVSAGGTFSVSGLLTASGAVAASASGSSAGVFGAGGPTNGAGVWGDGGGTGPGGYFRAGTAATASTAQTSLLVERGNIAFTSTANPNSDVAISNALTPKNVCKAWLAGFSVPASTSFTVSDGFNIASVALSGGDVVVTFASSFASTAFVPCVTLLSSAAQWATITAQTNTTVTIRCYSAAGAVVNAGSSSVNIRLVCFGAQ